MHPISEDCRVVNYKLIFIILACVVTFIVLVPGGILIAKSWNISIDKAGVLNAGLGLITAWFSGLAFVGMIATLMMQHSELKLQRQELVETRDVLINQQIEMERQNFGSMFLHMIKSHHEFIGTLKFCKYEDASGVPYDKPKFYIGRDAFQVIESDLFRSTFIQEKNIVDAYEDIWVSYEFGHYIGHLCNIISFLHDASLDKSQYIKTLKSQLTSVELELLFYHCLSPHGERHKHMVEELGMFENLESYCNDSSPWTKLVDLYNEKAYQSYNA